MIVKSLEWFIRETLHYSYQLQSSAPQSCLWITAAESGKSNLSKSVTEQESPKTPETRPLQDKTRPPQDETRPLHDETRPLHEISNNEFTNRHEYVSQTEKHANSRLKDQTLRKSTCIVLIGNKPDLVHVYSSLNPAPAALTADWLSFSRQWCMKRAVGISLRLQGKLGFPYNVKQLMVKYVLLC